MNISYYRRQIKKLEAKIIANADLCNESEVKRINKEIANYEKFIKSNGVSDGQNNSQAREKVQSN